MRPRALLAALAVFVLPACGARAPYGGTGLADDEDARNVSAPLTIQNNNWQDVTIWVLHDGRRNRLSLVAGSATTKLTIPAWMLSGTRTIQLLARPTSGAGQFISELFFIPPGARVEWTLQTDLQRSAIGVY